MTSCIAFIPDMYEKGVMGLESSQLILTLSKIKVSEYVITWCIFGVM